MSNDIQSALVLGENIITSGTPLYFGGEVVRKAYLGDLLVYTTKRVKRLNDEYDNTTYLQ